VTATLALELQSVTKTFGTVKALDGASLGVPTGTVHALLGENGAGKTTLMRIVYGLTKADAGILRIDGIERPFQSPAESIRSGIGMVLQHPAHVGVMPVWENAILGGSGPVSPNTARQRMRALSEQLGLALDPDAPVESLSVAAQQRLEILKAVNRNAKILILDEPTAILAPEEAADLYRWLRAFASDGGTVVVITHKLEEARRFTDELTVLRGGQTVMTARSPDASVETLTTAMIGASIAPARESAPSRATTPVLEGRAVTIRGRSGFPAVKNADFLVRRGEIVGIAGVEGSGHHELLRAMADRLPISSGTVTHAPTIGFVPEDRHRDAVVEDFTLAENFAIRGIGKRGGRMGWRSIYRHVDGVLTRHDVRARSSAERFSTLSGGNQQKLVLARELEGNPELIVVENPTRGLDVRASAAVRERLVTARNDGAGIVFYSSDLDEIIGFADRVLVVHSGEVREVSLDRALIGAAMLGVT
jgi:general nucleoside transport system ATP-binding protein